MLQRQNRNKKYGSLDIRSSTPIKGTDKDRRMGTLNSSQQTSPTEKKKIANIKKIIGQARKFRKLRRIEFIEGDESLRRFPPKLHTLLREWCATNKTDAINIAKTNWGRKDGPKNLHASEGRRTMFVSAESLTELPAARYTYGCTKQLIVVRHKNDVFLVQSLLGHACEVTLEDGSWWTAIPWYAWEIDQDIQRPDPTKAQFFRLTQRNINDTTGNNSTIPGQCKPFPTSQQSPTSKKLLVSEKRTRDFIGPPPSAVEVVDTFDDSDDEPLAKRLHRSRSNFQTQDIPILSAISPLTPTSLSTITSPPTPSPTQFFAFKREISDLHPLRKPVNVITSVKILFKHAEVAGIITNKDTMLMVFPRPGVRIAIIRDDYEEFKRLQQLISKRSENTLTKILVMPE